MTQKTHTQYSSRSTTRIIRYQSESQSPQTINAIIKTHHSHRHISHQINEHMRLHTEEAPLRRAPRLHAAQLPQLCDKGI